MPELTCCHASRDHFWRCTIAPATPHMGCRAGFVQVSQHYLRLLPGYDRDRSGTEIHRLLPSRSGRLAIDLRNELVCVTTCSSHSEIVVEDNPWASIPRLAAQF